MNNKLLSLEEIAFQIGKGFGFALETLFSEMMDKSLTDDEAQTQYADKISDIIYDNTGLNMDVDLVVSFIEGEQGPAMMHDTVRNGHILSTHMDMYNGLESKDADEILSLVEGGNIGTFNHKTGRVTGLLSEKAKNILYLRWSDCRTAGFTPGELAAVTLHEVGHAVTMLEYAGHITTANMILAALLKTTRDDSVETRKIVFKKAADVIGGDTVFDGMETITDSGVVTTVVMDAYFEERVSINGSSLYDVVTSEQLADQYCNRMGYGRHLVVALEKIDDAWFGKGGGHDRSRQRRMLSYVADILKMVAGVVGIVMTIVSPTPLDFKIQAVSILTVMTGLMLAGKAYSLNAPMIYDTTRVRLLRVREDTVIFLKDLGLPNNILKEKLKELEQIDKVISTYLDKEYRPIISVFMSWFSQKRKDNDAIHNLQRKLEELSANNLFVQSARLRTMGNEGIVDFVKGVFNKNETTNNKELIIKLAQTVQKSNYRDNLSYVSKRNVVGNSSVNIVKHFNELVDYSRKHIALHNKYIDFKKNIMAVYAKAIKNNTSLRVASSEIYDLEERYINAVVKMRLLPSKELAYDDDDNTVCTTSRSHELNIYNADLNPKLKESSLYKSADRISLGIKLSEFNELKELLLTILSNEEKYEDSVEKLYASKALQNSDFKIIKEFIDGNGDTEVKEIEQDLKNLITEIDKRDTYEIGGFGNLLKELTDILAKPIY